MFEQDCIPLYLSPPTSRLIALRDINYSIKPSVTTWNFRFDIWTTSLMVLGILRPSLSDSRPFPPIALVAVFSPFTHVKNERKSLGHSAEGEKN
jgi:hypothetical protein